MSNFCLIKNSGGPISVRISIDNGARASFRLYLGKPKSGGGYTIVEEREGKTGTAGVSTIEMQTKISELNKNALAWHIRACTTLPAAENYKIKIEFLQDGQLCKTTTSTQYGGKVPNCGASFREIKNQVVLMHQPEQNPARLWESI